MRGVTRVITRAITRALRPRPGNAFQQWYRRWAINIRDTMVLLRQFRGSLLALALAVLGGGVTYWWLAHEAPGPRPASLAEATFLVLSMIFLQANTDFPSEWYLQAFFFVMPAIGFVILSQGVADLGVLLFDRRARGEAWQVAVAETYSDHIVIVGLDHLGFRVARALHDLDEAFVAIELNPEAALMSQVQSWGVPIIQGDANKYDVLKQAGLARAHTIVITSSDDVMNLQIAIHARAIKPSIRAIVRLFDDDFAREVCQAFGITAAYSASALAAPAFAATAANLDIAEAITINGRVLNVGRVTVAEHSKLIGRTIGQLEDELDLSVILLVRGADADLHPPHDMLLLAGDELRVFAENSVLHRLHKLNR